MSLVTALVIANHFPPIGGVGVQRALQFVQSAPEFGVRPIVLTGPGSSGNRWEPHDPTRLDEIDDVEVIRMPGPVPPPSSGSRRRFERLAGTRSPFLHWWLDSIIRCGTAEAGGVDVILAELAPYQTALAAQELSRKLAVPWVADLQDPWALDEMWLYPSALHRLRDRAQMRRTLRTADAVVMNTPEAAHRLLREFPELRDHRVSAITNGFDSADFDTAAPPRDTKVFKIVHTGYLHTELALEHRQTRKLRALLGGMPVPGVELLTRSHVYLLQAVAQVVADHPDLDGIVEVHLVGELSRADRDAAAPYPFVRLHGFQPHTEAVAMMRGAELLFLPMQDLPAGIRAGLVPGKTYEYMASGTPILAAVPEGDARDMLLAVGTADVCAPAAVDCLTRAILERVRSWQAGEPRPDPEPEVLERVEKRSMVAQLATVLREVVDRRVPPT